VIAFYADENVDQRITNGLRRRGVDVLTAQEAGLLGTIPDVQHLEFAIARGRALRSQDGLPDKTARISCSITYAEPVVISEFGGDALQGWHADPLTRFSEEYQEDLYRKTIAMLRKIPAWRGVAPWILADFRSPRRVLPNVQDGWNRKGLIGQNGTRKKAFAVLKSFYDEMEQRAAGGGREDRGQHARRDGSLAQKKPVRIA
jgi:Domain of unknown function (DUF5615)